MTTAARNAISDRAIGPVPPYAKNNGANSQTAVIGVHQNAIANHSINGKELAPGQKQDNPIDTTLGEFEIQSLYAWIDEVQLSKPKRNFTRDFSDGVNTAEIIKHFIPKLVELHNYSPANAVAPKIYNWQTLNSKVFRRLGYSVDDEVIKAIVNCRVGFVEVVLNEVRKRIDEYLCRDQKAMNPELVAVLEKQREEQQEARRSDGERHDNNYTYVPPPAFGGGFRQSASGRSQSKGNLNLNMKAGAGVGNASQSQLTGAGDNPFASGMSDDAAAAFLVGSGIRPADYPILLEEKCRMVLELQDTVEILQIKIAKMEELLQLKDGRIEELNVQLHGPKYHQQYDAD